MADFEEKYPNARTKQGKPRWRKGVRSISLKGLDYLGIDDEGNLYWDDRPIKTKQPLELSTAQGDRRVDIDRLGRECGNL